MKHLNDFSKFSILGKIGRADLCVGGQKWGVIEVKVAGLSLGLEA